MATAITFEHNTDIRQDGHLQLGMILTDAVQHSPRLAIAPADAQNCGEIMTYALRSIRPDIPVIICTGFRERIDQDKAAAMGINGLLMKQIVKTEMVRTVRQVLDDAIE
jgi:DNA-binding NarL/FixJ family response regulator